DLLADLRALGDAPRPRDAHRGGPTLRSVDAELTTRGIEPRHGRRGRVRPTAEGPADQHRVLGVVLVHVPQHGGHDLVVEGIRAVAHRISSLEGLLSNPTSG